MAVNVGAVAIPEALVAAVAVFEPPVNVPLAPDVGAAKVTVTFATGFPPESLTVATSAAKALLICTVCGVPLLAVMDPAGPFMLLKLKLAVAATPVTEAVTLYEPKVVLAVKTADLATPEASVVAVFTPPANVPPAPEAGATKVTRAPLTGLPPASVTVATNGNAKAVLIFVL